MNVVPERYQSFSDFYPFYLTEHRHRLNRRMHFIGTSLVIIALLYALVTSSWWAVLLGVILAYAFAWAGHYFFEKNRPATFKYPVYSLLGDWVMYRDIWLGRTKI